MRYKFNVIEEGKEEPTIIEAMSYKKMLKRLDPKKKYNIDYVNKKGNHLAFKIVQGRKELWRDILRQMCIINGWNYFENTWKIHMKKREKGRKWDGRSRVSTNQYKKNWNDIFGQRNVVRTEASFVSRDYEEPVHESEADRKSDKSSSWPI